MKMSKKLFAGMLVLGLIFIACSKNEVKAGGKGGDSNKAAAKASKIYPIDYSIAYFNLMGFPSPTVRDLFFTNDYLTQTIISNPAKVTIESTEAKKGSFTATLLVELVTAEKTIKFARLQVDFTSDGMTEKSYVSHIKFANLINGQTMDLTSDGSEIDNGEIFGNFFGFMEIFWDRDKLKEDLQKK
jgi:hypothetical protein